MTRDEPAARFRVSGLLKLRSRPGLFVCDELVTGAVSAAMVIGWPLNGDALTTSVPIREVDFIDYSPGVAGLALFVRFEDEEAENEEFLRDFLEVGVIVEIWPPSTGKDAARGASREGT